MLTVDCEPRLTVGDVGVNQGTAPSFQSLGLSFDHLRVLLSFIVHLRFISSDDVLDVVRISKPSQTRLVLDKTLVHGGVEVAGVLEVNDPNSLAILSEKYQITQTLNKMVLRCYSISSS